MKRLRHWLAHLLGWNYCRIVGHLDLECVGCGKIYPASQELREALQNVRPNERASKWRS